MTAVVLARGAGRRMREAAAGAVLTPAQAEAAQAGRKAMMPIGSGPEARPFLDFVLMSLRQAGCTRVCLIVAPDQDDVRHRYRGAGRRPDQSGTAASVYVELAYQAAPTGTAHAVLAAAPVVGDEPFLVINADNLYPVAVLQTLVSLETPGLPGFTVRDLIESSHIPFSRVASFALIEVDHEGWLRRIIEKPGAERLSAAGDAALVSMNAWRFDARIFDACRDVPLSARGEFELPEAVALALSRGVRFRVVPAQGPVLDLSRQTDVATVSAQLDASFGQPFDP